MFTWNFLINLVMSFIAATSFSILFNTNKRHLICIGFCGLGTYAVYHVVMVLTASPFWAAFVSSIFAALYSEFTARIRRAPTIIFLIGGIIPTVPGGALFYTMKFLVLSVYDMALTKLIETLEIGLGIAGGIVTVSIIFSTVSDHINKKHSEKQSH